MEDNKKTVVTEEKSDWQRGYEAGEAMTNLEHTLKDSFGTCTKAEKREHGKAQWYQGFLMGVGSVVTGLSIGTIITKVIDIAQKSKCQK